MNLSLGIGRRKYYHYIRMKQVLFPLNIYCDESHPVKHDGCDFFVLGCVHIDERKAKEAIDDINAIKEKHGYKTDYEIKWSMINGKNLDLILDVIKYTKANDNLGIRVVVGTNKSEKTFTLNASHEQFYLGIYNVLLSKLFELDNLATYNDANIHFDIRNTNSEANAKRICKRLFYETANISCIPTYRICDSKNENLIQLIDLFIGATSYERMGLNMSENKLAVLNCIKNTFGLKSLNKTTPKQLNKYNVFVWGGIYGSAN